MINDIFKPKIHIKVINRNYKKKNNRNRKFKIANR